MKQININFKEKRITLNLYKKQIAEIEKEEKKRRRNINIQAIK